MLARLMNGGQVPLQLVKLGYLNYRPVTLVTDTSAT
jgi:hypothetical protein